MSAKCYTHAVHARFHLICITVCINLASQKLLPFASLLTKAKVVFNPNVGVQKMPIDSPCRNVDLHTDEILLSLSCPGHTEMFSTALKIVCTLPERYGPYANGTNLPKNLGSPLTHTRTHTYTHTAGS